MKITYSEDQLRVINSRNKNLLVSAAAGAGKTSVLVERIIKRVTDSSNPIDIDRILVVTFTKAAAAEMKERIRLSLEQRVLDNPGDRNLQRQATLIHNAEISTIDGFCLKLVRNNFHKIGLDPSFRIANDGEIELLKKDVLKQVMDAAYEEGNQEFYELIDRYSTKDKDTKIESSIIDIYTLAMSCPKPEVWLENCKKDYSYASFEQFKESELSQRMCSLIADKMNECKEIIQAAVDYAGSSEDTVGFLKTFTSDSELIDEILDKVANNDLLGAGSSFASVEFARIASVKCDEVAKQTIQGLRNEVKKIVQGIRDSFFAVPFEQQYDDYMASGQSVSKLIDLVLEFKREFDKAKRERDIIDFSDMSHMAIDILIDSYEDMEHYTVTDTALEYRDYFEEIMIDEYQDSNQVQEIILASISRENTNKPGNRFMVGDVKQSIYRFRLARPEIFRGKESDFEKNIDASEVVRLKENHRSRHEVVDSVNDVFKEVMHKSIGGVEYNENEQLNAAAVYEIPEGECYKSRLVLCESKDMKSAKARENQAECIANLVEDIVATRQVIDKKSGKPRPADYGDIAILFRGIKSWREPVKKAFDNAMIPYHMEGVGTFYSAKEVKEVLNLLRVIDNPLNDIPLYGVMSSFFGKMDDELCARIKAEGDARDIYLWDKLIHYVEKHPDDNLSSSFVKFIEKYRLYVTYTPIGDLITDIVTSTGYMNYVSALADGKQREANLELLIKKATDYSKTSFSGLFHFLRYIELIKKNEEDEGEANIFDENSNTVRVMTIHKSKGLEFPFCIVGGADTDFNLRDGSEPFIADIDEGLSTDFIDADLRIKRKTIKQLYMVEKIKQDTIGEEIRILYVAMTRAKEQLIVVGSLKDAENSILMPVVGNCKSYLDIIRRTINKVGKQHFQIEIVDNAVSTGSRIKKEINRELLRNSIESNSDEKVTSLAQKIKDAMFVEYKYKNLEKLYTKTTVSELKMAAMEETQEETKELFENRERSEFVPEFAGGGREVSGTDRGSAYHKLLQLIDFTKKPSQEEWEKQFEEIVASEAMTREELELVPKNKFFAFAGTELADRMHKASLVGKLYKEQPFVIGVSADRVSPEFPEDETVLVQGIIDVYFEEDNKIVVMDYKTDRVETENELVERYKTQINIYAEALEKLTEKSVCEKLLYSFGLNATIMVE